MVLSGAFVSQVYRKCVPTVGRVPETKSFYSLFSDSTVFQVIASDAALVARFELLLPPFHGPCVELDDVVRFLASCFKAAVVNHCRQRHADFVSDDLYRFGKRDALDLHHEIENRAPFVTTEAVEDFLRGTDGERGRLFFMERAARHPVRALLLELHVILYDPDDVCLSLEIVDECLGVTHLKCEPRLKLIVSTQPVSRQ